MTPDFVKEAREIVESASMASHESIIAAALTRAYRAGLKQAAEIVKDAGDRTWPDEPSALVLIDDIRAEAGEEKP